MENKKENNVCLYLFLRRGIEYVHFSLQLTDISQRGSGFQTGFPIKDKSRGDITTRRREFYIVPVASTLISFIKPSHCPWHALRSNKLHLKLGIINANLQFPVHSSSSAYFALMKPNAQGLILISF